MGIVETLRSRGNLTGSYVRPVGSDGYPPAVGTTVKFVLCQPVQDMVNQGKRLGWANKGTIGNVSHLRLHGDHTGHSLGKTRGIIYAKDTGLPSGGKAALLTLCRMDDYNTRMFDYFNIDGRQYNFAGVDVGPSGDVHLHVSIRQGQELTRITLFDDIAAVMAGTFRKASSASTPMPDIFNRLGFIAGASLVQIPGDRDIWLAGRGKRAMVTNMIELSKIRVYLRSRNMSDRVGAVDVLTEEVV
jgi:hypothetical protein